MLETVQSYIRELPNVDFNTYYQQYVLSVQDENLMSETQISETRISDSTFSSVSKLLVKIQREIGNL